MNRYLPRCCKCNNSGWLMEMGIKSKEMSKYHAGNERMSRKRRKLSTGFLKEREGSFQANKVRDAFQMEDPGQAKVETRRGIA